MKLLVLVLLLAVALLAGPGCSSDGSQAARGWPCTAARDCASNHCSGGVCCDEECTFTCFSCAMDGARGTCTAVPAGGQDLGGACPAELPVTCGLDGTCDGAGACRFFPAGSACGPGGAPPWTCAMDHVCRDPAGDAYTGDGGPR